MLVNVYCRVSTEDQKVKQQAEYVKSWALRQGYAINLVVVDEESGRLPLRERKQFSKLLADSLVDSVGGIVVHNLERLTRNWDDVTYIEAYFRSNPTIKLISTQDSVDLSNASGRMMFRVKMAVACFMPEDMREKQKIGIDRAKKEGRYKGRPKGAKNRK